MWKDSKASDPNKRAWLDGLKVLEYGDGVSAAFATKLLADLGANVIKVESRQGDLTRRRGPFPGDRVDLEKSGLFIYLNTNKRGVSLDLRTPDDRDKFAYLLRGADILVHNVTLDKRAAFGLESEALSSAYPELVTVAISPFGESGPYKDWRAYDLNIVCAGGWAHLSPKASHFPDLPPLKASGEQSEYQAGTHACFIALATWWHRLKTGAGQAVELSRMETVAAMLELSFMQYTYAGREISRTEPTGAAPWRIVEAKDGQIFALCLQEDQWQRFVGVMGSPEWAKEEIFSDRRRRGEHADALYMFLEEWTREHTVEELFRLAQDARAPWAPVKSMKELYEDRHLVERNFFIPLDQPEVGTLMLPGAPYKSTECEMLVRTPAPRLGEHNAELESEYKRRDAAKIASAPAATQAASKQRLPLDGIRILDFTWVWAGPYSTLQFAHLGAEVLKIESARRIDGTRETFPVADNRPGINRAGYFNQYSQGKRSVTINLGTPEGVATALELARHCDIVIDNFAAGTMERLGLGYKKLCEYRHDIIQLSLSGCGQTGPYRKYVSYGPPLSALAGLCTATGYSGGPPAEPGVALTDPQGGITAAIMLMAALRYHERTGKGQFIDVSQFEAAVTLVGDELIDFGMNAREPERLGNHDRWMCPHNCYKALGDKDKWISIAAGTEDEWRALCGVMEKSELADDPKFRTAALRKGREQELDEIIGAWTQRHDRWDLARRLQAAGVPAFPSMSNKDLATNEHLLQRHFLVQLDHPEVGRRIHCGMPWKMHGSEVAVRSAAPLLGADTDAVLRDLLGYSEDQIGRLRNAGALQ